MEIQVSDAERQDEPGKDDGCPIPPKLHWALVLLFMFLTLGFFGIAWSFIQSSWIKKINPKSNATVFLILHLVLLILSVPMDSSYDSGVRAASSLVTLLAFIMYYCAYYSMHDSMVRYFNDFEYTGLEMSGWMTFFFSQFYVQHHMTRIARWKLAGKPSNP